MVLAAGMLVTSCPADVFAAQAGGTVGDDTSNGCLKIFNRGGEDGGAAFVLSNKLQEGKTYTISAKVAYTGGADERTLLATLQAGGDWQYRTGLVKGGDAKVKKGEWTTFETTYQPANSDHGKPFDGTNVKLFFETPAGGGDKDDFYLDDVVVTENGGETILNESFDANQGKAEAFNRADIKWLKEGDDAPPDPSEIVPLQVNGDAETGTTEGWKVCSGGGENGTLVATTEEKYEGQYSIKITNRANCASGPMQDMSGKLEAGKKYKITGRVKYTTGPSNRRFEVDYQFGDEWRDRTNKSFLVKRGQWSQIYATFEAKASAKHQFFIATTYTEKPTQENDLMDFYVDDIVISLDDGEVPEPDPQGHECIEGSTLVSGALKAENNNTHVNPLFDYKFGADPYAITYNGRVYIYTTNDSQQLEHTKDEHGYPTKGNGFDKINTLNVFSSADMVNWTDHGEISVDGKGAASLSWAPAVGHKTINGQEKFFLYFANGGNGIYVLESDSPIGPFEAPATGSTLITKNMPQGQNIPYLFDPAVLVDDDGTGYLYYGGGFPDGASQEVVNNPKTFRVVKLKDNMVELDGDAKMIEAPGNFEDSGIHKYNGKYYFTYCSNFANDLDITGRGNICAMVSDKPMEGFEFAGIVFPNQGTFFGAGTGGNNHHCFFEFNGKNYLTYHAQTLAVELGFSGDNQSGYRSTHIDEFEYGENDSINVVGTWDKRKQVKDLNPFERVEAETIAWSKGIKAAVCEEEGPLVDELNMMVTEITNGDYLAVSGVDFDEGANKFTMHAAVTEDQAGGKVELYLDSTTGEKVGEIQVVTPEDGNEWTDVSCDLDDTKVKGKHNLYMVFKGTEGKQLMYADYWKFDETPLTTDQQSKVDEVIQLIGQIGTVTKDSEAAIKAAKTKYDALSNKEKRKVTNANILTAAEETYQEIKYQAEIDAVIALINGIGKVSGDETSKKAIDAAKEAYNKLTEEQKKLVTNFGTLTEAEETYGEIKEQQEQQEQQQRQDKAAADAVIALINKIGKVTGTQTSKTAIDAARAAYNRLTEAQKKLVTNFGTLTTAEKTYQTIKDAENNAVKKGQSYKSGNYQYKVLDVSKKTVSVTKALKASKTIKVPSTVKIKGKSYKVVEVAKGAFKNNKKVQTVTIGKNVKKIGANAFSGSKNLKKVTISSTVLTTIDKQAFYNCKKLATVKITSKKLKTVAKQSFKGTAKKIKVDVPNSKKKAYKKIFKKKSGISSKAVFK